MMCSHLDMTTVKYANDITDDTRTERVADFVRSQNASGPKIMLPPGNLTQPSTAVLSSASADQLASLMATMQDMKRMIADVQNKAQYSELAALRLCLAETKNAANAPKLKGVSDSERFVRVFRLYIEHAPGVIPYDALCMAVQAHPEAYEWVLEYGDANTDPENRTLDNLLRAFTERFAPQMLTKQSDALEELVYGKVKMDAKKGIFEYVARFRHIVHIAGTKDEQVLPYIFRNGLTPDLKISCSVDYRGARFKNLEDIIKHAIKEQRKLDAEVEAQDPEVEDEDWGKTGLSDPRPQNVPPPACVPEPPRPVPTAVPRSQKRKRQDLHLSDPNGASTYFSNYLGRVLTHREFHHHLRQGLCGRCGCLGHIGKRCPEHPR